MPKPIPDRWEEYEPVGTAVEGTRFIPFKVPLKKALVNRLPEEYEFTPTILIEMLSKSGLDLGLVIDLTFTTRYYNPREFQDQGVDYCKIFTAGRVVPSRDVREKFYAAVDAFLQRNPDNGKLIGVHCTHGINRTGYVICRYMIDKLNFDPDEAIKAVKAARGYGIERQLYIDDLKGKTSASDTQVEDANCRERKHDRNDRYGNMAPGRMTAFFPERDQRHQNYHPDDSFYNFHSCRNTARRDWSRDNPRSGHGSHRDSRPREANNYNHQERYNGTVEDRNRCHVGHPNHMRTPNHMGPPHHMQPPRYDVNRIRPYGQPGSYVSSNHMAANRYSPPNRYRDYRYK